MFDIKLASKQHSNHKTIVKIGDEYVGKEELCLIAGPCAVESEKQLDEIAKVFQTWELNLCEEELISLEPLHMHSKV